MVAGVQLFLTSVFSLEPQATGLCHPHSSLVFQPLLTKSRSARTYRPRDLSQTWFKILSSWQSIFIITHLSFFIISISRPSVVTKTTISISFTSTIILSPRLWTTNVQYAGLEARSLSLGSCLLYSFYISDFMQILTFRVSVSLTLSEGENGTHLIEVEWELTTCNSEKIHRTWGGQPECFLMDRNVCCSGISKRGTHVQLPKPGPETRSQMQTDANLLLSCFLVSKINVMPWILNSPLPGAILPFPCVPRRWLPEETLSLQPSLCLQGESSGISDKASSLTHPTHSSWWTL